MNAITKTFPKFTAGNDDDRGRARGGERNLPNRFNLKICPEPRTGQMYERSTIFI